ncbi:glycosyltransferase family 4 protein [Cohnella terricola]|uniref:Glycosyltransferase family 4 protein n=2 Tax=Cohnella terricola TaxID=1289167 RepID=A0A559JBA5_9BACL|nr:glycosyltransferase family 4 protein [Cohnella terricola]
MIYTVALPFKKMLVLVIPQNARKKLKKIVVEQGYSRKLEGVALAGNRDKLDRITGVNLVGYSRAEMGIGESCRIAAKSLATTQVDYGILNFTGSNSSKMSDLSWTHKEIDAPEYNINVFHLNAEQMFEVYTYFGQQLFENRYNIGFWHWELEDFPDDWLDGFKFVDEIWVPSSFVANSVAMKSPVPVVRIPHGIEVKIETPRNRSYYGLPENTFLFLTMYDMNSFQERKNPMAAINAFKHAFKPTDRSVGLVVKVNHASSNRSNMKQINEIIKGYENIHLINTTLSRSDTNALIQCTDSFISLHRSEGFGLGLAEAMYLGKPAIGTNWSSNVDFMNDQNSCLVRYELVPLGQDYGPYQAYQRWADPDIVHAGEYMKKLVEDPTYYSRIAANGQKTIKRDFSPAAVGELITRRLKYIQRHFGGKSNDN